MSEPPRGAPATTTTPRPARSRGRELALAVGLTLLGSGLALTALGQRWALVVIDTPPPSVSVSVSGGQLGAARPLALVALAGALALLATRRRGRVVVGILLVLSGMLVLIPSVRVAAGAGEAVLAEAARLLGRDTAPASGSTTEGPRVELTLWPWAAAVGGALVGAAGLFATVRGRSWPGMGARYQAPAAPRAAPGTGEGGMWEAQDRGEDPTV